MSDSPAHRVRWGVLGAANIARAKFLPAVAEAGGFAAAVGARDVERARVFAAEQGIARAVQGYQAVLADPEIDAVYVALPNPLHAEWATAALRAGKAVLCEKPLTTSPESTQEVLSVAAETGGRLWEAFVFPFHDQHRRLVALLADGAIGELREIVASFHFPVTRPGNIRLSSQMFGGALADVGCYPLRLAYELFGSEAVNAAIVTERAPADLGADVEAEAAGVVTYADGRRLLLTCGFRRQSDTAAILLGTEGSIRVDNPWHPRPGSRIEIRRSGAEPRLEHPTTDAHSFTALLRHIHAVLTDEATPQHLAADAALPVARALDLTRRSAGLTEEGNR